MIEDPNLIRFTQISPRKHEITLLVHTRPESANDYLSYFRGLAERFAYSHKAKMISDVTVELNPFRESSILTFTIKGYKRPEKHRSLSHWAKRYGHTR